jgi:hypothetical protein
VWLVSCGGGNLVCHRFVNGDRIPIRMVLPLYCTVALSAVNVSLQPALHSWLTEISDCLSAGMMCASVAWLGRLGWRFSCVVWLDCVCMPLGSVTVIVVFGV